jgi:heterodisulfide reductase subunit B
LTLGEAIYEQLHKSSAFALVRSRARAVFKDHPQICQTCGYDKHVEICHKKAIKDFPHTALVSEINSPDNLLMLCPNCHWEFDHS